MKVGTKSILFGAHAFWLHPWFVALAWWKLYGFPWDPRLWVAFFVHDLGYVGSPNMDGYQGERHPYFGARIMKVFGTYWYLFTWRHSRFLCRQAKVKPSKLCWADKYAFVLTPWWLYIPMTRATGEIREYKIVAKHVEDSGYMPLNNTWKDDIAWWKNLRQHSIKLVALNA